MIQKSTFLGLSLRTRSRRRVLVVAYYFLLVVLALASLHRHNFISGFLIAQTFLLGSFFGGFRADLPVKPYSDGGGLDLPSANLISLNLTDIRLPSRSQPLDERELAERDRAHYLAYRLLLILLFVASVVLSFTADHSMTAIINSAPALLWLLLVVAISLPQSVILWTEPEPLPDNEMTLVARPL